MNMKEIETIVNLIFFCLCLAVFIWRFTRPNLGQIPFEFEEWCLFFEMIYYGILSIFGLLDCCNKSQDKKITNFFKDTLFKFLWTMSMSCLIIFYLGYYVKWFYFENNTGKEDFWLCLFFHGFVQICIVVDIIVFDRAFVSTYFFDVVVLTVIYVIYCIVCALFKKSDVYIFLNYSSGFILSVMILGFFAYLCMYFLYQLIEMKKNHVTFSHTSVRTVTKTETY